MKKRICAFLLAVTVVLTGVPETQVLANPVFDETVVETEDAVAEEEQFLLEEAVGSEEELQEDVVVEKLQSFEEEEFTEEVSTMEIFGEEEVIEGTYEDDIIEAMAYGSSGKGYEGVSYLSLEKVNSMSDSAQEAYYDMCDSIEEMNENGMTLENVVIKADKERITVEGTVPVEMMLNQVVQNSDLLKEDISLMENNQVDGEREDLIEEFNTLMEDKNYFKNQLNATEKAVYNVGLKNFVNRGVNSINLSYRGYVVFQDEAMNAVSALVNTYPNKFNWMDVIGKIRWRWDYYYYYGRTDYRITIDKSKYYNANLEKQANSRVNKLVKEAFEYAENYYPDCPTYGIIKYFNDWICENNYYEYKGIDRKKYGKKPVYFFCHSCYGILLKGYGVCESYALAMTKLLDKAGIRNIYALGDCGRPDSGHAWNYVQMPDGKWYLLDSTWNDSYNMETWDDYLLVTNDGEHYPYGRRYTSGKSFTYYALSNRDFNRSYDETICLDITETILKPNEKIQLTVDSADNPSNYYKKYIKEFSSSNPSVAKVDKNGKITAGKKAGAAEITCNILGRNLSCIVYVYKFTGLKFAENNKSSYTLNYANDDDIFTEVDDQQQITLRIEQQNKNFSASYIANENFLNKPTAKSNKPSVVEVDRVEFVNDEIKIILNPVSYGTAQITAKFGGKTATLTVKVTKELEEEWFDFSRVVDVQYKKKAVKPKVTLSSEGKAVRPKVTFKVSYVNNKKVGTATVKVTGTGRYGGILEKEFEIIP